MANYTAHHMTQHHMTRKISRIAFAIATIFAAPLTSIAEEPPIKAPTGTVPTGSAPVISAPSAGGSAGTAPAVSAPSGAAPESKSAVISAPDTSRAAPDGAISAPQGSTRSGAPVISAPSAQPPSGGAADPALSVKKSLYHDLNMKNIAAKRDYLITFDISNVEQVCLKEPSTIADCRKAVDQADEKLQSKINQAEASRSQQRALELQEEANALQRERNRIEEEKPDVVLVERNRRRRRHPYEQVQTTVVEGANGQTVITETRPVYPPVKGDRYNDIPSVINSQQQSSGFGVSGTISGPIRGGSG